MFALCVFALCVCVCVCVCVHWASMDICLYTVCVHPPAPDDVNNSIASVNSSSVAGNNQSYTISWATIRVDDLTDRLLSGYRVSYSPVVQGVGRRKRQSSSSVDVPRNMTSVTLTNLVFFTNYSYSVSAVYSLNGEKLLAVAGPNGLFSTGEGGMLMLFVGWD